MRKMNKMNKINTLKIVGGVILVILIITLTVVAAVFISKALNKKTEPTTQPQVLKKGDTKNNDRNTTDETSDNSNSKYEMPKNRNTIYEIKGKFVRYDPDLYTGAIAKNSSQHPDYVKLVQSYGNKKKEITKMINYDY